MICYGVRLKPDTTFGTAWVRLKPDTTFGTAWVQLKPDTTLGTAWVRLKPDATSAPAHARNANCDNRAIGLLRLRCSSQLAIALSAMLRPM